MDGLERIEAELIELRNDLREQIKNSDCPAMLHGRLQKAQKAARGLLDELEEHVKKYEHK